MTCPSDGDLRSYLDSEHPPVLSSHIAECRECQARLAVLRNSAERLSTLLDSGAAESLDGAHAYQCFVAKHGYVEPRRSFRRPLWVAAAACCVLILLLSFAPARGWGQRILSMLRVQKVAVLPLDLEALSSATNGHEKLIAQMISDRVVVTMKPGEPTPVDDAAAAGSAAGFEVKTLDSLGAPNRILVRDEAAFHIELNRDRMLALLDAAGRTDISLPKDIDGGVIAVHIPKIVEINYGECLPRNRGDCIHFIQVPSPTVSIPPSLDISTLAEAALQLSGMSAAEAHAFCQSVDWSSTLVVPVPQNSSSTRAVSIDGVNGTLVETAANDRHPSKYALIWVKSQRIYAISGNGKSDRALAVAESLN